MQTGPLSSWAISLNRFQQQEQLDTLQEDLATAPVDDGDTIALRVWDIGSLRLSRPNCGRQTEHHDTAVTSLVEVKLEEGIALDNHVTYAGYAVSSLLHLSSSVQLLRCHPATEVTRRKPRAVSVAPRK